MSGEGYRSVGDLARKGARVAGTALQQVARQSEAAADRAEQYAEEVIGRSLSELVRAETEAAVDRLDLVARIERLEAQVELLTRNPNSGAGQEDA